MNPMLGENYFANLHSHTFRCMHASGTEEEYVLRAIGCGMDCLGFADHSPWPYRSDFVADMRMRVDELDGYLDTLRALREKYKGQIRILIGLECEAFPEFYPWLEEIRTQKGIDYFILGNHYDTTDENSSGTYFGRCRTPEIMRRYTQTTVAGMESGHFLYLCHPDLPLHRYPCFDSAAEEMCRTICETAKRLNLPLEYNLLGMKRNPKARENGCIGYTSDEFWKIAAEIGNVAVIGADAHSPEEEDCAQLFYQARRYLHELGVEVVNRLI